MRYTVIKDDHLLEEAQEVLGTKGVRETVEAGLRETVGRHRLGEFRRSLGKVDFDLTLEELSRFRSES